MYHYHEQLSPHFSEEMYQLIQEYVPFSSEHRKKMKVVLKILRMSGIDNKAWQEENYSNSSCYERLQSCKGPDANDLPIENMVNDKSLITNNIGEVMSSYEHEWIHLDALDVMFLHVRSVDIDFNISFQVMEYLGCYGYYPQDIRER